jgi:excinuclease ABC subunit A
MLSSECPLCKGERLRQESLSIKFAGYDIAELSRLALNKLAVIFGPYAAGDAPALKKTSAAHPEKVVVAKRIAEDFLAPLQVMLDLGLGYLTIERSTPTLSPGELQRLRLATQVRSNLFGVVHVLDEPSARLHPADTEALLRALDKLKGAGNSLFVVEHEIDVIRHADWIVDVGPAAGEKGGHILYSGLPEGLRDVEASVTRHYIYEDTVKFISGPRIPRGWLKLEGVSRNNLVNLAVAFPLGVLTSVTGVSGSGKSSLVSQVLVELVADQLGLQVDITGDTEADPLEQTEVIT